MNGTRPGRATLGRLTMIGATIGALTGLLAAGCGGHGADEAGEEGAGQEPLARIVLAEGAMKSVPFSTVPAGRHPIDRTLRLSGSLDYDGNRVSRVGAPLAGRILRIPVMPGDSVRAGQTLAEIESAEASAAVSAWRAARADASVRQREAGRARLLFERQAISRAELDRREADLERAEAARAESERRLSALGIARPSGEPGEAAPPLARVVAPLGGVLIERLATPGAMVAAGEPLFVVADLSTLWLQLQVFEKDLAFVRPGLAVEVVATAWPDRPFTGTVARVGDFVEEHSRTIEVLVILANPGATLKPGMSVRAELTSGEATSGLTVPAASVVRLEGGPVLFVRRGEREFERVAVRTGRTSEDWVEILEGLEEGDLVVTEGVFILKSEAMKASLAEEE